MSVERRVLRIINDDTLCVPNVLAQADALCERLFMQILQNDDHPLRELFITRATRSTRFSKSLQPPFAKTKRFSSSFIKYCK